MQPAVADRLAAFGPQVSERELSLGKRFDTPMLRRMNERRVLNAILHHGPLSRTALIRAAGMTGPTVTKATESLLKRGLLEELDAADPEPRKIGRPVRLLQLATRSATVFGVVLDTDRCTVVTAGLDGRHAEEGTIRFPTPASYDELLATLEQICRGTIAAQPDTVRGLGISVPGLVNAKLEQIAFSPNLHILDQRSPARDLQSRLGISCRMFQESHGLCLGESMFGAAKGLPDFAMLDVSTGLSLGVMSGGTLLTGSSGLAGELGHMRIDPAGVLCGCGNRGCLETLATDSALARLVSEKLGRRVAADDAIAGIRSGSIEAAAELEKIIDYLAVTVAAVINIFNPTTLFVHGALLSAADDVFARLLDRVRHSVLSPALADCRIIRARGSKRTGALAGIIDHFISSLVPRAGERQ